MSEKVTPIHCTHEHFHTKARAESVRDSQNRIIAYRLKIEAWCEDCKTPFHFPNYITTKNEAGAHRAAVVARKCTLLITPIVPGAFAPEEN